VTSSAGAVVSLCLHNLAARQGPAAGRAPENVFAPVMVHNTLGSLSLLSHFLPVFTERCVAGIKADEARCRAYLDLSPASATLLAPKIGYRAAAALAKEALEKHESVRQLALDKGIVSAEEADKSFGPGTEST